MAVAPAPYRHALSAAEASSLERQVRVSAIQPSVALHQNVGEQLGRRRLRRIFSELRSTDDDVLDLLVDRLQFLFLDAHLLKLALGVADGIAVLAHVLHLLARP